MYKQCLCCCKTLASTRDRHEGWKLCTAAPILPLTSSTQVDQSSVVCASVCTLFQIRHGSNAQTMAVVTRADPCSVVCTSVCTFLRAGHGSNDQTPAIRCGRQQLQRTFLQPMLQARQPKTRPMPTKQAKKSELLFHINMRITI